MTATATQEATVTTLPARITLGETFTHSVPRSYMRYQFTPVLFAASWGTETIGYLVDGEAHDECKRCGSGIGHFSFNGEDDICYSCHGEGYGKPSTIEDMARRAVARDKALLARQRKADAAAKAQRDALQVWEAANPEIAAALVAHRSPAQDEYGYVIGHEDDPNYVFTPRDRFLTSLADQATYRALSPKQTEAATAALARLVEKAEAKAKRDGVVIAAGHWGTVGKRAEVEVTVKATRSFDSDYGTRWLVTMQTAEGQTIKTWTSGAFVDTAIDAEKSGEPVRIKATVKDHGSYRDLPETTVTRVAVI